MKPPKGLPSVIVAAMDSLAREFQLDPGDFWAYLYKRKAPPTEIRRALIETFFPVVSPDDFLSTSREDGSTIHAMRTEEFDPPKKGRPSVVDHELFKALAKAGVTLAEEADKVKRSTSSIRSMCYPKGNPNRRPAPEALKQRWLTLYKVPTSAWR